MSVPSKQARSRSVVLILFPGWIDRQLGVLHDWRLISKVNFCEFGIENGLQGLFITHSL
jgi:hypothetical protein